MVRVGLKAWVVWEDGVRASWVEEFGRVLWSVVREFRMEVELGCYGGCWVFLGGFGLQMAAEWVECNAGSLVDLGDELGVIWEVF